MKTEFDLLNMPSFRQRPAMYIGGRSISKLKTFLDGFATFEWLNKIKFDLALPFWLFLPYVAKHYHHSGLAYSWDGIILLNCDNDEAKSLDKLFELFDEFQKTTPLAVSVATRVAMFFKSTIYETRTSC